MPSCFFSKRANLSLYHLCSPPSYDKIAASISTALKLMLLHDNGCYRTYLSKISTSVCQLAERNSECFYPPSFTNRRFSVRLKTPYFFPFNALYHYIITFFSICQQFIKNVNSYYILIFVHYFFA